MKGGQQYCTRPPPPIPQRGVRHQGKTPHLVGVNDGSEETFALTPECWTQTLRTTDQETDHQVGVLLHTLTCGTHNTSHCLVLFTDSYT